MTLDNYIFYLDRNIKYIVLGTIDSVNKKYLVLESPNTVKLSDKVLTPSRSITRAFRSVKNKSDFEAQSKIIVFDESEIIAKNVSGFERSLKPNVLSEGDLVRYNFVKYIILGFVLNEYAQLNIPMPVLFDKQRLLMDYKSLIFSKLSDDEILELINTNFVKGNYSNNIEIPFVDSNSKESWGEKIKLISAYNYEPYKIYISKILDKKEESFSSQDFLKDFVFSNQEENLELIADKKPEFYVAFVNFLDAINNTIYKNKKSISETGEVEPEIIDFEELMKEELDFEQLMNEQLG